ncbi:MAG TPA: HAMP domain-containing sensor histidine kinase [Myxococcota bacterium]|nr:HAMP domain-containing sensor histidine kinase [Myxococcota bacterium]
MKSIKVSMGASRVAVQISDTGSGIPADILPRLFEPFFTTKPAGVGTGLGLAICKRITESLAGDITLASQMGAGTTVRVTLPLASSVEPSPAVIKPAGRACVRPRPHPGGGR